MSVPVKPGDLVYIARNIWSNYRPGMVVSIRERTESGSGAAVFDLKLLIGESINRITIARDDWDDIVDIVWTSEKGLV